MDPKLYRAVIKGYVAYEGLGKLRLKICSSPKQFLHQKNSKGNTLLHIAARMGSSEICQVLINHMSGGKIEAGEKLIRVVNKNHYTALHDAVRNGHEEIVNLLIRRDPELALLTNNVGESPLFSAADKRHDRIAKPILNVAPDYSIEDQQDNEGNTALHLAVLRGRHGKIFKSMIEDVRVDKAIANSAGHTVIDILLMQEQNFIFKWWITTFVAIYEGLESLELAINRNGEEYARFRKLNFNQVQQIASTNLPVITIIATVSFAAGFTMPGGYVGDGPNAGICYSKRFSL
ncbi:hypothetical protein Goshw_012894 [Gossypium schwendimanii]|uniref:PGG domain-containing protein n=1 Tax=Gossypium schwendimanii TaxID=34291 RepID=A0A7J9MT43_GOSSC|nr:hypothetical protein [Gossypium schwendimanii]